MSITNVLIPYRSTCQIYTLLVAYSVSSLFAFIYSKSHEITQLQQLVRKTADRQPTEWRKERGGERKKERKRRPAMKNLFDASVQPEMKRLLFQLQVSGEMWKSHPWNRCKYFHILWMQKCSFFSLFKYVSYINDIHKTSYCMCPRHMYLLQLEIFSH